MTYYRLFGLIIDSEIELPELLSAPAGPVDISVSVGGAPNGPSNSFEIEGVATYWVAGGSKIVIDPHPSRKWPEIRLFLLGSAMGIALHQRGDLPLHANSVVLDGRAFAMMGASGAGKSTLTQWMMAQGLPVLGDDVCAVRFDPDGIPIAYPGVPRLRLWQDALDHRGVSSEGLRPSYPSDPDYRKFDLPVAMEAMAMEGRPLRGIFCLEKGGIFSIEPLSGTSAVEALFAHTYRGQFVSEVGDPGRHWQACVSLAQAVPILFVRRTMDKARMDEENAALLTFVRSLISQ